MKKPWSITTTLRNPERLRSFLKVVVQIEGEVWNQETQIKYQILLIKERLYGFGNKQFYNGLKNKQVNLIEDISKNITFKQAKEIFQTKKYEDPAMRGRQSLNPLKKIGLVVLKDKILIITSLGKLLLKKDYDLGEIFFKSFIKWQIPNPDSTDYKKIDGYDIKPFIGVLHLINQVNEKAKKSKMKSKGLSKQEFSLFTPILINYKNIETQADRIIELRRLQKGKNKKDKKIIFDKYQYSILENFLETKNKKSIKKLIKNLSDYGDNAIRYFRLTRFLYIRGGGYYIDLEPRRMIEINNLLRFDKAKSLGFNNKESYLDYISDISQPILPWETIESFKKISNKLIKEINQYESKLKVNDIKFNKKIIKIDLDSNENEFKKHINDLRLYRRELQEIEIYQKSQNISQIIEYIEKLKTIHTYDDKPILLEKLITLGLTALNDAKSIKPNYPVGDDNEPTFTAPANVPDIECYYEHFNTICEVTMLTSRNQWYNEGQPVMRHLRDFEDKNNLKNTYCLFIAPKIHRDTLNTFWFAIKYEYEGKKQFILPFTINNFIKILMTLVTIKNKKMEFDHKYLLELYKMVLDSISEFNKPEEWLKNISNIITNWQKPLIKS